MNLLRSVKNLGLSEWRCVSNVLIKNGQVRMFVTEDTENAEETPVDPSKDRRTAIPLETGLKYMQSSAYQTTYGDKPVFAEYRRNHKGQIPPRKTRKSCVRKGIISTGNPCPICRDEYLVMDPKNVSLLKQFISEHTGQIISYSKTGLCQKQHSALVVAIARAKDQGRITYDVPFREYNYNEYTSKLVNKANN